MNKKINILNHTFKNPIIPASGTFNFGYEFASYYDINILGSISLKGTTKEERFGNPLPRICECPSGMINAIGLQNPGVRKVIDKELELLDKVYKDKVIANVGGNTLEDYVEVSKEFCKSSKICAIELNVSCPNVKHGGIHFSSDINKLTELIIAVKKEITKPLIVKLSPNTQDITQVAIACEKAGADALTLVNTFVGMRINLRTKKPILSNIKGGYSGPGIFPIALRMVYECYQVVNIPIIASGGINSAYDVLEYMYAGASLCQVGTANLIDPYASKNIIEDLDNVMNEFGINDLNSIIGIANKKM